MATMTPEPLRDLTDTYLRASGAAQAAGFGVYAFTAADPFSELARHVERVVFDEFFGNSPELLAEQYDPFEANTIFLTVLDHHRRLPAGVIRVIRPSPAGFKSLLDIETVWGQPLDDVLADTGLAFDHERVWDLATLSVAPDYRGAATRNLVSLALYQTLFMAGQALDVRWFVGVADLVVLDLLQQRLGHPFQRFARLEPLYYLGSPKSLPVYIDVPAYRARLSKTDPAVHDILFAGKGLEASVAAPDWAAVLPSLTA
jgi:hypothetical protein